MPDVTAHAEYGRLLRAVLDRPGDDLPRLVLADWLEEHGEAERAEFVRLQCEIARMEESGEPCEIDPEQGHTCTEYPCPVCRSVEKYTAHREREANFALKHLRGWFGFRKEGHVAAITDVRFVGIDCTHFLRRGFVHTVACPLAAWLAHGPGVVRAHPVEAVGVTDREPLEMLGDDPDYPGWMWCRNFDGSRVSDGWGLPGALYDMMTGQIHEHAAGRFNSFSRAGKFYPSLIAATAALSVALVAWARATDPAANPHAKRRRSRNPAPPGITTSLAGSPAPGGHCRRSGAG